MNASGDLDRQLEAFLADGPTDLPDSSFDAVRDHIESERQRVVIGPWRMPTTMNRMLTAGGAAVAAVLALFVGAQLLGSGGFGGPGAPASPTPTPTPAATATASPTAGFPKPVVMTSGGDAVQVTVQVASPGWDPLPEFDALSKNDDGLDAPNSVGVALLAWTWPAGTGVNVYGDPCRWLSTTPATPATTPEAIATAFAAQALTDPTAPVDVTVGGYQGKAVTLTVPMSFDKPNATREEKFADCDADMFGYYGIDEGADGEPARNVQGAGQVDELWILDVGGAIVILDATYGPATPAALVEEVRSLAASATFD